ncbi:MAG: hypothetical protein FJ297_18330 [Planctomycetes bacterium]|nr:hypothetical protein [Planctomycetota bacterium]
MTTEDALRRLDDQTLQRLVDGELTAEQYRTVLERIDDEPRQWRDVALAFLEDQALGRDLRPIPCDARLGVDAPTARRPDGRPDAGSRLASATFHWLTIAAGLVAAFLGGYSWNTMPSSHGPMGVDAERAGHSDRIARNSSGLESGAGLVSTDDPAANEVDPEFVTLVVSEPGRSEPRRVRVPIFPIEQAQARWDSGDGDSGDGNFGDGSPVPPDVREVLERIGSRVTREQYWMPTTLPDGRDVVIPIDQVDITPPAPRRVSF